MGQRLSNVEYTDRVQELIDKGIIDNVTTNWGGRQIVIVNINGEKVPFYRSKYGTSGKTAGKWFPFFGFGKSQKGATENDWIVKGDTKGLEDSYGSSELKKYSDLINTVFDWDTVMDSPNIVGGHPALKGLNNISENEINKLLYNNEDSGIINDGGKSIEKGYDIIRRINKKAAEQSQSKQESGGKAPVTKPEGKSDVVGNQQKVETKRVEKVAELEAERDMAILREGKPEVKMEFVSAKELVDSKDPIGNKKIHSEIKENFKKLKEAIDCLYG